MNILILIKLSIQNLIVGYDYSEISFFMDTGEFYNLSLFKSFFWEMF